MEKKSKRHKSSESDYCLGAHRNIKKKKKSHGHFPRSRDRPRYEHISISESSSELSESSSSRTESLFPSKSNYEMYRKPSRGLSKRAA